MYNKILQINNVNKTSKRLKNDVDIENHRIIQTERPLNHPDFTPIGLWTKAAYNKNRLMWNRSIYLVLTLYTSLVLSVTYRKIWNESSFSVLYYKIFYLKRYILANIIIVLLFFSQSRRFADLKIAAIERGPDLVNKLISINHEISEF